MKRLRVRPVLGLAVLATVLATGAALADPQRAPGVSRLSDPRVLLLPAQVEVWEIATTWFGVLKPEPTLNARRYTQAAIERELRHGRVVLVPYTASADPERNDRHLALLNLHAMIRREVLGQEANPLNRLPSKRGRLEWSVGPGMAAFREDSSGATHALLLELTARRMVGGQHATLAALGSDRLIGSASLVDLNTGDIVWFNSERGGSLDTEGETSSFMKRLLHDMPF